MNMPGLDGVVVIKYLYNKYPRIKIIILSGYESGGRRPVLLDINPDAYFTIAVDLNPSYIATAVVDLKGGIEKNRATN